MKSREGGSPQRKESSNKPSVSNIMLKKGYYSNRLPGSKNDKSPTNLSTSIGGVHNPYLISPIKVTDDKNISEKYNKVTFSSDSSSKPNLRDVISSYSKYSKKEVITEKIGEEDQEYTDNQNKSLLRQERVLSSKLNNFGIKSIKCDSRFGRDRLSQSQNCEDGMDNSYAVKSYEEKLIDHHLHAQSQPLGTRAAKGRGNCPMKNLNSQIKSEREMYCGSDFKGMSLPKINGKLAYIENALNLELTKKSGWLQNRKLEIKQKDEALIDTKNFLGSHLKSIHNSSTHAVHRENHANLIGSFTKKPLNRSFQFKLEKPELIMDKKRKEIIDRLHDCD